MVGYSKESSKLSSVDFAVAGAGSGLITRALGQPLDVLKIRFQLQVEPISNKSLAKYRSIFQAVNLIFKEEGPKAFWKGHLPAQFLSISYGLVQFWTFEMASRQVHHMNLSSNSLSPFTNFACGSVAGCTATLVSFPFDVLRTRLVAQSEQEKVYKGITEACYKILNNEGPLVFYRGLWPTLLQVGPHAGVQFMCYKLFDNLYKVLVKTESTSLSSSIFAGSLAGLCAKCSVYPFDLAKKRLQIQGFEEGRKSFGRTFKCKGLQDCLVQIYRVEGVPGFFKGLQPSLVKAIFASAAHFSTYEMICKALSLRSHSI